MNVRVNGFFLYVSSVMDELFRVFYGFHPTQTGLAAKPYDPERESDTKQDEYAQQIL